MSAGHDEFKQEPDKISTGKVLSIGVTALVIFGLGIIWAIQIQRDSIGTINSFTPDEFPTGRQDEIGMVYQPSFSRSFAAELAAKQHAQLDSVGWVDQKTKKVHIPIERAMKDYVADATAKGGTL